MHDGVSLIRMCGTMEEYSRRMLKKAVSKAGGESKPEACPRGYVEDFDEPRTKLADFFSILLGSCMTGFMPGCPFVRECHGSISFAKYFRHSIHQLGDSLDIFRRKILSKSRV